MKVGSLEETVTVTGESPIIDTQSVRRQTVISGDVMNVDLPAARSYAGVMMLIPSTITQAGANLDIQVTPGHARVRRRGRAQQRSAHSGGWSEHRRGVQRRRRVELRAPTSATPRKSPTTTSGGLGEAEVGGPSFSIVPKTGGNTIKGSVYQSNVTQGMVGDNYTPELTGRGT